MGKQPSKQYCGATVCWAVVCQPGLLVWTLTAHLLFACSCSYVMQGLPKGAIVLLQQRLKHVCRCLCRSEGLAEDDHVQTAAVLSWLQAKLLCGDLQERYAVIDINR